MIKQPAILKSTVQEGVILKNREQLMSRKTLVVAFILFAARSTWSADRPAKVEMSPQIIEVATGGNEFATELYARLTPREPTNLIFSPFSISAALAMTYAGADGHTKSEIARVLHFSRDESDLHSGINAIRKMLVFSDKKSDHQLRVVNRLWGQKDYQFLPKFLKIMNSDYNADLGLVFFKRPDAATTTINSWVEKQTDHQVQNLIAPGGLDRDTRLLLTNVIYFKARWQAEFTKSLTSDAPFYLSGAQQVTVPTMYQTGYFGYNEFDDAQVIELPYRMEKGFSMLIFLPKSRDGLNALEKQLSAETLHKWTSGLELHKVKLHLPRFRITLGFSLKDALKSMGLSLPFSSEANFSKMVKKKGLFLTEAIHKTFIDVNEEGTVATASTAMTGGMGGLSVPKEPVVFRADHPFLFLIREHQTKSIVFLGRLMNPK